LAVTGAALISLSVTGAGFALTTLGFAVVFVGAGLGFTVLETVFVLGVLTTGGFLFAAMAFCFSFSFSSSFSLFTRKASL
jgi:hypothetical protein